MPEILDVIAVLPEPPTDPNMLLEWIRNALMPALQDSLTNPTIILNDDDDVFIRRLALIHGN